MLEPLWLHREDPAGSARVRTQLLRHSDAPSLSALRAALTDAGVDVGRTVLAQFFPDGGSDCGVLITPDGREMVIHVGWGSHHVRIELMSARLAPSYAIDSYFGWVLWNEETDGEPRDPAHVLVPFVRFMTELFRSPAEGHTRWLDRLRQESRSLATAGRDPMNAAMTPGIAPSKKSPGADRYGFVFPDGPAFVATIPRSDPAVVEEVPPAQLESVFGPLHSAALAYLKGEAG